MASSGFGDVGKLGLNIFFFIFLCRLWLFSPLKVGNTFGECEYHDLGSQQPGPTHDHDL